MRLTLRTLLAYLDDRLAPQQAKEIGQKLTTSPFATELADRIRSVVRRRRLAKESTGQKNIDANLIAEYLDDQLTPELVALIEKEILTSDHSLAEVAATHQIIGSLNDPVEIADSLKERLHRLGPQPDADEAAAQATTTSSEWKPLEAQSVKQKRSPMLLLGAMVLGWLVLVATDSNLFRGEGTETPTNNSQLANNDGDPIDAVDDESTAEPDAAGVDSSAPPVVADATTNPKTGPASAEPSAESSTGVDPATTATGEPVTLTNPDAEGTAAAGSPTESVEPPVVAATDAMPSTPVTEAGTAGADTPPTNAEPPSPDMPVTYTVDDPFRMFLQYNPQASAFVWASQEVRNASWNEIVRGELLGLPHPFHATVSVLDAGWSATVRGQSLVRFAADGSGAELYDGGLVLQSAEAQDGKPFLVTTGGLTFEVDIPADGRRVGIQVMPSPLPIGAEGVAAEQANFLPGGRVTLVSVFAADTAATIRVNGREVQLATGTQATWRTDDSGAPMGVAATMPDWIFAVSEVPTDSTRELLMEIATTLQKSPSVSDSYEELLDDRNPLKAEYAAAVPALIRELDSLCEILLNTEQSGVRRVAIDGLQYSMTTIPGAMDKVSQVLRTRLTGDETADAVKLLMGVSPVEGEDRFVSEWLVSMLENRRASMRELAIVNLERLTGTRDGFQTDDDATRRSSSVRRWRRRLSRNDGRLLSPPG